MAEKTMGENDGKQEMNFSGHCPGQRPEKQTI